MYYDRFISEHIENYKMTLKDQNIDFESSGVNKCIFISKEGIYVKNIEKGDKPGFIFRYNNSLNSSPTSCDTVILSIQP